MKELTKQSSSACQLPTVPTEPLSACVSALQHISCALNASRCHALHQPEIWTQRPSRDYVYSHLKTHNFKVGEKGLKELLHSSDEKFPPPIISATHSSRGNHFSHVLSTHRRPRPPPLRLLPSLAERSHACKWGPPSWAAWRLEGSLVDPPISPNPPPGLGEVE